MQNKIAVAAVAIVAGSAIADIARVGEFESLSFESFDTERWVFESGPHSIMNGIGEVFATPTGWIHTTSAWTYVDHGSTKAYSGSGMLGNTRNGIGYTFGEVQSSFGGFFATISSTDDGVAKFFLNGALVAQDVVHASVGGAWSWNGWSVEGGFDRVEITSNYNNGLGGFLMHDEIRVSQGVVPAPGALAMLGLGGMFVARRRGA